MLSLSVAWLRWESNRWVLYNDPRQGPPNKHSQANWSTSLGQGDDLEDIIEGFIRNAKVVSFVEGRLPWEME